MTRWCAHKFDVNVRRFCYLMTGDRSGYWTGSYYWTWQQRAEHALWMLENGKELQAARKRRDIQIVAETLRKSGHECEETP